MFKKQIPVFMLMFITTDKNADTFAKKKHKNSPVHQSVFNRDYLSFSQ